MIRRQLLRPVLPVVLVLVAVLVVVVARDDRMGSRAGGPADICDTDQGDVAAVGAGVRPAASPGSAKQVPTPGELSDQGFELTWSDEFEGDSLDERTWSTRECWNDSPGFVNDSQAWLPFPATSDNVVQREGVLRLQARKGEEATERGQVMTTAMLTTRERFDTFRHGVIEARMKIPTGRGLWPAFWLMGNGTGTQGWPQTGEIDIFEFVNNASGGTGRMYSSVHWGGIVDGVATFHQAASKSVEVPWWGEDEFHTFSLHRTSEFLRFYVDGQQVLELLPGEKVDDYPASVPDDGPLFEDPMHVRLSLEVGGPWAGQGHEPAAYEPGDLVVDYVRAWK